MCSRSHSAACGAISLVGEAPRERADLLLLGGQLVQAHARAAGARRDPMPPSATARQRAATRRRRPEAVEAQDLPALVARDPRQRRVRVDGDGMADRAQHRQVGLGVGVRPRRRQVDALALGQLADRLRLALAVGERAAGTAGVLAVDASRTPSRPRRRA